MYIATDSRITWVDQGNFDHAVKTYAMHSFPAIIGYCGDALVSQMIITQASAMVSSAMNPESATLNDIANLFLRSMKRSYRDYPKNLSSGSFTVAICGKRKRKSKGEFECYKINSDFNNTYMDFIKFPLESGPLIIAGSGAGSFQEVYQKHCVDNNPNRSTSRDVFHAFSQTIGAGLDQTVGPIPQVVSVIRKPNTGGFHCGIVCDQKRYINGQLIDADQINNESVWFNQNFEITDPSTKMRVRDAQTQPQFGT